MNSLTSMSRSACTIVTRQRRLAAAMSVAVAAAIALPASAQTGNDAPPPELDLSTLQMPPGPKPLAESWDAASQTPESVQKALAALEAMSKAHAKAPAISNKVDFKTRHAMGEQSDSMSASFGSDKAFRMTGGPMTLTGIDSAIFLEIEGNTRKYLKVPVKESQVATLREVLPSPLPFPLVELRNGVTGDDLVKGFNVGGMLEDLKVVGMRQLDGKDRVLMKAANGDAEVTIDPTSGLASAINAVFTPQGAPPGMTVALDIALNPVVSNAIDPAIVAPQANGRKAVESLDDLMMPVSVGDPAVDFTLSDTAGNTVSLSDLKGQVVVLDFWASWCAPCQMGLPKLNEFAKWAVESGKPVKVFGVDVWERIEKSERADFAKSFWEKKAFSFPTLVDTEDALIGGYGFQGIPVTVIVGPDGNVAAVHQGLDPEMVETLKRDVEKALGAAPEKAPEKAPAAG